MRPNRDRDVIRPLDDPLCSRRRHRRPARQPRSRGRDPQAQRRLSRPPRPPWRRRSSSRTSTTSPRGSTTPRSRSRRTPSSCSGTAGPKGGPGCRSGAQLPIPKRLLAGRRDRPRPDLRRADERHGVRHGRPPRRAGVGGGWAAACRPGRRPDRARRRSGAGSTSTSRPTRSSGGSQLLGPPEPKYRRGYGALYLEHVLQARRGLRLRLPPRPAGRGGRVGAARAPHRLDRRLVAPPMASSSHARR